MLMACICIIYFELCIIGYTIYYAIYIYIYICSDRGEID